MRYAVGTTDIPVAGESAKQVLGRRGTPRQHLRLVAPRPGRPFDDVVIIHCRQDDCSHDFEFPSSVGITDSEDSAEDSLTWIRLSRCHVAADF